MNRVVVAAHAKVNLFLHVLAREVSGYHSIETLFALLELHDELTIEKTNGGTSITVDGADTGPTSENLAFKAARMVITELGEPFGVRIHLAKAIPVQAGLGGGSSDGAAALHGVNALAGNRVPERRILEFAAALGSDVPFFASRAAYAVGWGHGERLLTIPGPSSAPALVVHPGFGVSTRDAYESVSEGERAPHSGPTQVLSHAGFTGWDSICHISGNDFEAYLLDAEPRLGELLSRLEATDPLLTRLCGSGSAIAAIYRSEQERDSARSFFTNDYLAIPTRVRAAPAPQPAVC